MVAKQNLATSINSDDYINRTAKLPLIQHPGSYEFYGTAISVLGILCERATGKSLAELVKERITDPMKIKGLVYDLPKGSTISKIFWKGLNYSSCQRRGIRYFRAKCS